MPGTDDDIYELSSLTTPWALRVAVSLGLPDLLEDQPRAPAELAAITGTSTAMLARLLRYLCTAGFLTQDDAGRCELTVLGRRLCTSADPLIGILLSIDGPTARVDKALSELHSAVVHGQPSYDDLFGKPFYQDIVSDPQMSRMWNELMSAGAKDMGKEILQSVALTQDATVVDIGGGPGHVLACLAAEYPRLQGILVELAGMAPYARELFLEYGLADRCRVHEGSFFDRLPAAADAYLLVSVLHEWPDPEAIRILGRCAEAMAPDARLYVVDRVVDSGRGDDHLVADLDIMMLAATGGRERTREEVADLLRTAGLGIGDQILTESGRCITEAALLNDSTPSPTLSRERLPRA
jgi:2,7-dihydroxy-5-methyl-1-naphthoate 7-O-methyltransferase